jgi:methylmalonyl-CoA mutase
MNLWSLFHPNTNLDWETKIKKDLKLDSIEPLMWKTNYGTINPIEKAGKKLNTGNHSSLKEINWRFESDYCTNKNILSQLSNGINGINIVNQPFSENLFKNVMNDIIYNNITIDNNLSSAELNKWTNWINLHEKTNGSLRIDPISSSLSTSFLINDGVNFDKLKRITSDLKNSIFQTVFIDGTKYSNLFVDPNVEISHIISHLNESIELHKKYNIPIAEKLIIKIGLSANFIEEVSKIRALKALVIQLLNIQKINLKIQFECSYDETIISPIEKENNLLRLTTAFLGAVVSGVNSIELNESLNIKNGDYWNKITANIPILLLEEAQLNNNEDVLEGAHLIEQMSYKMALNSWDLFKNIEQSGGLIKYAQGGYLKDVINIQQEKKFNKIASNENKILGFNFYSSNQNKALNNKNLNTPFYLNELL